MMKAICKFVDTLLFSMLPLLTIWAYNHQHPVMYISFMVVYILQFVVIFTGPEVIYDKIDKLTIND